MMHTLAEAIEVIRKRRDELAPSHDPIECKAEGLIEAALEALQSGAELLGEEP